MVGERFTPNSASLRFVSFGVIKIELLRSSAGNNVRDQHRTPEAFNLDNLLQTKCSNGLKSTEV